MELYSKISDEATEFNSESYIHGLIDDQSGKTFASKVKGKIVNLENLSSANEPKKKRIGLSAKERKSISGHKLSPHMQNYERMLPLNHLWCKYMASVL
jgi:hypothetical protein